MKHFDMITLARVQKLLEGVELWGSTGLIPVKPDELKDLLVFAEDHLRHVGHYEEKDFEALMELTQLQPGAILTEENIRALNVALACHEDESEKQVDLFHQAREQVIKDLGGDELLRVFREEDERRFGEAASKALDSYYKRVAAEKDKREKGLN